MTDEMRVVEFAAHGGPDVLVAATRPRPSPAPDEVLVAVESCGVNRMDAIVREGPTGIDVDLPHVPGAEIVGRVVETGDGVDLAPGALVARYPGAYCGACPACRAGRHTHCPSFDVVGRKTDGGYAEYVTASARDVVRLPDGISPVDAATIPVAFTTAWRMLRTKAGLAAGDTAVVLGATGDVGVAALALAERLGATTIATTRAQDRVAGLEAAGADHVLVTAGDRFADEVRSLTDGAGAELVVDYLGEASWPESIRSLRNGGAITSCGYLTGHDAATDLRFVTWRELRLLGSTLGTRSEFEAALAFALEEDLALPVAATVPLEAAGRAHRLLEDAPLGKVVLSAGTAGDDA